MVGLDAKGGGGGGGGGVEVPTAVCYIGTDSAKPAHRQALH